MKLSDVDLYNPDNFVHEVPHEMFRVLRREAPVYFHPEPDGPGFWVLTKYEDVKSCSRNPQLFSSWLGGTNIPDRDGEQLDRMRVLMLNMDPPKHRQFRNIVNKAFTPRMVKQLEPRVRGMAKRIVDRVAHQGECDFVSEVAAKLPMEVICEMMGVPNEDREHIYDLTNKLIGFDDPEFQSSPKDAEVASLQRRASGLALSAARPCSKSGRIQCRASRARCSPPRTASCWTSLGKSGVRPRCAMRAWMIRPPAAGPLSGACAARMSSSRRGRIPRSSTAS